MAKVDLLNPHIEPSDAQLNSLATSMVGAARASRKTSDEKLHRGLQAEVEEVRRRWHISKAAALAL